MVTHSNTSARSYSFHQSYIYVKSKFSNPMVSTIEQAPFEMYVNKEWKSICWNMEQLTSSLNGNRTCLLLHETLHWPVIEKVLDSRPIQSHMQTNTWFFRRIKRCFLKMKTIAHSAVPGVHYRNDNSGPRPVNVVKDSQSGTRAWLENEWDRDETPSQRGCVRGHSRSLGRRGQERGIETRATDRAILSRGSNIFNNPEPPSFGSHAQTKRTVTTAADSIAGPSVTGDVTLLMKLRAWRFLFNSYKEISLPFVRKGPPLKVRWTTIRWGCITWIWIPSGLRLPSLHLPIVCNIWGRRTKHSARRMFPSRNWTRSFSINVSTVVQLRLIDLGKTSLLRPFPA